MPSHVVSKHYVKAEVDRLEQFACEMRSVIDHIVEYTKECEYSPLISRVRSLQVSARQFEIDVEIVGCLLGKEIAREESKV